MRNKRRSSTTAQIAESPVPDCGRGGTNGTALPGRTLIRDFPIASRSHDGVFLADKSGTVRYANRSAIRLSGASALVGVHVDSFIALKSGPGNGRNITGWVKHRSGMNIPFEGIRFGFKWKGIRYDCWTIRDITSRLEEERVRKAREREYRIQSVQLRAIFDSAPVIIWIASDASANEIVGNREAHRFSKVKSGINMSKTGPNPELLGHYDIYHNGSQLEPADMPMQRVASTGKALTDYEMEFRFDDGQKRTLMGNVTPILDPDGNPSGAVGAFLDISDRKRTEDRKDEFIGVASHELKTPLTSIKAYAQLLDRKLKDFPDESVRMILRRMDGQTNKLTGLVSDLLDASRIQTGALSVRMDDVDMDALIDEAISDILATAAENGSHTIEFRKRAGMRVRGDAFRLTQVIGNLLTNALKYSPPGAKVVVKTSEDGEGLTVSVRDFGIGIPPDKRERIFERFYQIKPENDPGSRFGSLGLGLYISSNIVRQHGGRMAIHSTPGKGSVFSFTLPVGRRGDTG